jgi:hypothetical protein
MIGETDDETANDEWAYLSFGRKSIFAMDKIA